VLASLPLPVAIVAAAAGGERSCATGTVCYLALDPPLLATPLAATRRTYRLLEASREFSVSILGDGQAELAVRAASGAGRDTFAERGIPVLDPPAGRAAPGVAGSVAVLWCGLESVHPVAGSVVVVGAVLHAVTGAGEPLLRFRRRYRALGAEVAVAEEAAYPL